MSLPLGRRRCSRGARTVSAGWDSGALALMRVSYALDRQSHAISDARLLFGLEICSPQKSGGTKDPLWTKTTTFPNLLTPIRPTTIWLVLSDGLDCCAALRCSDGRLSFLADRHRWTERRLASSALASSRSMVICSHDSIGCINRRHRLRGKHREDRVHELRDPFVIPRSGLHCRNPWRLARRFRRLGSNPVRRRRPLQSLRMALRLAEATVEQFARHRWLAAVTA